ncbi:hypothetical protein [Massilia sp.]|uniref:hypothetical protein n=1 Tax=Massilia sp. TaxID=1882437 RepID=UPI00352D5F4F
MRPQEDIDAAAADDRMLDQLEKKGKFFSDWVAAVKQARTVCEDAGLNAEFNEEGEAEFTTFQTAKAVRHTREDVSATLMLQVALLRRLDRNRNYMWVIIALLLYIAAQFK